MEISGDNPSFSMYKIEKKHALLRLANVVSPFHSTRGINYKKYAHQYLPDHLQPNSSVLQGVALCCTLLHCGCMYLSNITRENIPGGTTPVRYACTRTRCSTGRIS